MIHLCFQCSLRRLRVCGKPKNLLDSMRICIRGSVILIEFLLIFLFLDGVSPTPSGDLLQQIKHLRIGVGIRHFSLFETDV